MDSALLDTNVVLDYLVDSRPEHATAMALLDQMAASDVKMCVPATSLKDVYYVMSRSGSEAAARRAVMAIMASMKILPVDAGCCRRALSGGGTTRVVTSGDVNAGGGNNPGNGQRTGG